MLLLALAVRGQQAPVVPPGGVVNGASFRPAAAPDSAVAAGSIVSIFGQNLAARTASATAVPLPSNLADTSVTIGGRPAPLFFVSASQINAQVPWATPTGRAAVVVTTAAGQSTPVDVRVADVSPGLFAVYPIGRGPGAVQNLQAGKLVANTFGKGVKAGGTVVLYATGLGAVAPTLPDGAAASGLSKTKATPTVLIGDRPAAVDYSGLAPGYVGLYQINATVPADVPEGCFVPVQVAFGTTASNVVTISVNNGEADCMGSASGTLAPGPGQTLGYAVVARYSMDSALPGVPLPVAALIDGFSAAFLRGNAATPAEVTAALPPANVGCILAVYNLDAMPEDITAFLRLGLTGDPLDAGNLTLTGPLPGSPYTVSRGAAPAYQLDWGPNAVQQGVYTLAGAGGKQVGSFTAVSLNIPGPPLTIRDWGARLGVINRANDLTAAWNCPDPDATVSYGLFSVDEANSVAGGLYCTARCSDQRITIPSRLLQSLPPSSPMESGAVLILQPRPHSLPAIKASGLDFGFFTYMQGVAIAGYSVQ